MPQILRIAAALAVFVCAAGVAMADPPSDEKGGDGDRPEREFRGRDDWNDQDVRELIDTVMLVRASKQLELTDEETVVFVKRFNGQRDKFRALFEERFKAMRTLRESLESKAADDVVQSHLNTMMELDKRVTDLKAESYHVMAEGLDMSQQAKLYIFLQEFESNLRRLIDKARDRHRGDGDDERRWDRDKGDEGDRGGPHGPRPPMVPGEKMHPPPLPLGDAPPPPPPPAPAQ